MNRRGFLASVALTPLVGRLLREPAAKPGEWVSTVETWTPTDATPYGRLHTLQMLYENGILGKEDFARMLDATAP